MSTSTVCRFKRNRKYEPLANLMKVGQSTVLAESILFSDQLVRLYLGQHIKNKKGKIHYRESLLEHDFGLILV